MNSAKYWDGKAKERCKVVDGVPMTLGNPKKQDVISQFLLMYINKEDKILEIGAGSGGIAIQVHNALNGFNYNNLDISKVFVDFLNNKVRLTSTLGDGRNIPFKNNSFDTVWLFDVIEHINPENRLQVGLEVDRVLEGDGAIFINNPLYQSKHDQNQEWLIDDRDLLLMFLDYRIHQKITYRVDHAPYEFIVMIRGI